MSDLAYHIATELKLRFHEPSLTTTCSLPTCVMEPRLVYDESSLATVQAHHVAQVTEAAVREQIGQELHKWGVLSDMHGAWSYAEVWWDAEAIATTTDAAPTPGTRLDRVNKVREEIASEIEQQAHSRDDLMRLVRDGTSTDWVAGWDAATLAAAEIARGEA